MDEKDIQEYENEGGTHRYVLREDIMDDIIDATAVLVDVEVTRDWNDGLIAEWIKRENDAVFALTWKCLQKRLQGWATTFSEETQSKLIRMKKPTTAKEIGVYLSGMGEKSSPSLILIDMPARFGIGANKLFMTDLRKSTT